MFVFRRLMLAVLSAATLLVPVHAAMLGTGMVDAKTPYKVFTVKSWMQGNLVSFRPSFRRMRIEWEKDGRKLGFDAKNKGISTTRIYENLKGKRMWRGTASGSGFKLETAIQEQKFKVGLEVDQVQIQEIDGSNRQWRFVKMKDGTEVFEGDTKIGSIVYRSDIQVASLRDETGREIWFMPTDRATDTLGFLLLKDVPPEQQFVMMAELFIRER